MNRFEMIVIIPILIIALLAGCGADNQRPKGAEDISYWEPAWYDNEHIIYTKMVETVKFHHGLLADISNMSSEKVRTDSYICVMDLQGNEEKILKQFSILEGAGPSGKRKKFMVDGGKEIPLEGRGLHIPSDYSCSGELIVFTAALSGGDTDRAGSIYVMNRDGSGIKKIVEDYGDNPRLSPDNKQVLYEAIDPNTSIWSLCLINIDGTEHKKLLNDARAGVWSPDGKRIAYERPSANENWTEEEIQQGGRKSLYLFNLKTGENKALASSNPPVDWTSDGKRIFTSGFYNVLTGEWEYFNIQTNQWEESKNYKFNFSEISKVKRDKIVRYSVGNHYPWTLPESEEAIRIGLNYERLSPDGKRFVGDPKVDISVAKASKYDSSIGMEELGKSKEIKVLRINYVKTIK